MTSIQLTKPYSDNTVILKLTTDEQRQNGSKNKINHLALFNTCPNGLDDL